MKERAADPVPYETVTFVPGRTGLNLAVAADQISLEDAVLLVNLRQTQYGRPQVRLGQTLFAGSAGAVDVHSFLRMDLPRTSDFIRWAGAGTQLYRGTANPLFTVVDGGYSGNPLTLVPYRPALTGDPYLIVADLLKNRQYSPTGAGIPLGLPAPAAAVTAAIADILTTAICSFDSTASGGGSSVAANWTLTAGEDRNADGDPNPADPPTAANVTGLSGNAVEFTTAPGEATSGYSSIVAIPRAIDLSIIQAGPTQEDASDQDIIHLWVRCDRPDRIEEIRVYLVCSAGFDPSVVPGTDPLINTDAYVKALSPHAFTNFVQGIEGAQAAGRASRSQAVLQTFLAEGPGGQNGPTIDGVQPDLPVNPSEEPGLGDDLPTQTSPDLVLGQNAWSEFGNIGRPLRRGEFTRIGSTAGADWSTITGLVIVIWTNTNEVVKVACDDWFLTGGFDLDTADATDVPYDWRYTHYHTVTGDEGNPSPIMAEVDFLECLRQRVNLQPVAYGDAAVRQKFYRRGGSLPTDWNFVGMNDADGAQFTDEESETSAAASPGLEIDNDQPVSTVNNAGTTILAQPLPVMFGPIDGIMFGLGDPYRPGHLYWSKVERIGAWPPQNVREVCPPSEELQTGFEMAGQGWCHSRKRLYTISPNLTVEGQVSVQSTACLVGLTGRWAGALGPGGWYFVSGGPDVPGIYVTQGNAPKYLSQKIQPIFEGKSVEGFFPVDITDEDHLRLAIVGRELRFCYTDTDGQPRAIYFDLITETWGKLTYADPVCQFFAEKGEGTGFFTGMGSRGTGNLQQEAGETDNGTGIVCQYRSGAMNFDRPRDDKLLGDVVLDLDVQTGVAVTLLVFLNDGSVANSAMVATGVAGFRRYTFDAFGIGQLPSGGPQRARNVQLDLSWTHAAATIPADGTGEDGTPIPGIASGTSSIKMLGVSIQPQPDQILKRASGWEHLNLRGESYLTGLEIIVDTGGLDVHMLVERTLDGELFEVFTATFNTSGQRLKQFSWPVQKADQVRVRFTGDCEALILWKSTWLFDPEPPRISKWDTNWENLGDSYYTGLDIECDTLGEDKTIRVWVDQVNIPNPAGGNTFTVNASGRRYIHLTLGPARGHIYRFTSDDANVGLLYSHKWHLEAEPSEQNNWNQNYSIEGTLGDKAIKGILLECDTFGLTKTLSIQVDGAEHVQRTVNVDGRSVVQLSWPQAIGRVIRVLPIDHNPGRLYTRQWIFDEEPLKLVYWETQLLDHGLVGHQVLYGATVTIKSTTTVMLLVDVYDQLGNLVNQRSYAVASTGGAKKKLWVPFRADKGVLFKYRFTAIDEATGFWLYRPESSVMVLPWGQREPQTLYPFGDDDLDKVRSLSRAGLIAANPGGGVEVGSGRS